MENKFCFSEQKSTNVLESPKKGRKRADKRATVQQQQQQQQKQSKQQEVEEQKQRQDLVKDNSKSESAVKVAADSHNQQLTSRGPVSNRKLLGDVARDYLKLTKSIEFRLCLPCSNGLRELGGGPARQREPTGDQPKTRIGFVDLYRRRAHYDSLDIPLTALELISMDGFKSNREAGEHESPSQPLPILEQQQNQLPMKGESSSNEFHFCDQNHARYEVFAEEEQRLPGGSRRPALVDPPAMSSENVKMQWQSQAEGRHCQLQEVPTMSINRNYDTPCQDYDEIKLSYQLPEATYRSHAMPAAPFCIESIKLSKGHNLLSVDSMTQTNIMPPTQIEHCQMGYKSQITNQTNRPPAGPDSYQLNSSVQREFPQEQMAFTRYQPNHINYESQLADFSTAQCACQSIPIAQRKYATFQTKTSPKQCQTDQNDHFQAHNNAGNHPTSVAPAQMSHSHRHSSEEPPCNQYKSRFQGNSLPEKDQFHCGCCCVPPNPSLPHPQSAAVVPEGWQPALPDELENAFIQNLHKVDIQVTAQRSPLESPFDLKRVPIKYNLAESWRQQQNESLSENNPIPQIPQQRLKLVLPLPTQTNDELKILLPPGDHWLKESSSDEGTKPCTDHKRVDSNMVPPTQPAASTSSFESPFNLQPDRLDALLKAKPKKSCLKKVPDLSLPPEEQIGYEADYETQSDESGEQTSECTTEDNHLIEQGSTDTLTYVWYRAGEDQQMGIETRAPAPQTRLTGGLYSQIEKLKFQPIDKLEAGSAGTPILDEQGARTATERMAYFASVYAKLTREQRAQDIELRMGQLRLLQATSDRKYRRYLKANGALTFRQLSAFAIDSLKYCCPLSTGNSSSQCPMLLNESLLKHFIETHLFEPGMNLCEIFERDRVLIVFNPRTFELGKNVCMSVIVYGGFRNSPYSLPILRYMPVYNVDLPEPYTRFAGHLPLFVLISRNRLKAIRNTSKNNESVNGSSSSSCSSSSSNKKVRFNDQSTNSAPEGEQQSGSAMSKGERGKGSNEGEEVFALWLLSLELPLPIHVMMTVFNRRLDITRSSIMKVRGLNESHNCQDFMHSSKHYMRLSEQDMCILTNNFTEPIYMELSVREYAAAYPTEAVSALR